MDIIELAILLAAISASLVLPRATTGVASNGVLDGEDESRKASYETREEHPSISGQQRS
jgi:hypothetical protein